MRADIEIEKAKSISGEERWWVTHTASGVYRGFDSLSQALKRAFCSAKTLSIELLYCEDWELYYNFAILNGALGRPVPASVWNRLKLPPSPSFMLKDHSPSNDLLDLATQICRE